MLCITNTHLKGNAVDAIVGTTFCVGVIGMYHSGIGGGGFALVRDADGNYEAVDFRESAPAAAWEDMYKDRHQDSVAGGLAVAVPGEVRGLEYLHKKYGVSLNNGKTLKLIVIDANNISRYFRGTRSCKEPFTLPEMDSEVCCRQCKHQDRHQTYAR